MLALGTQVTTPSGFTGQVWAISGTDNKCIIRKSDYEVSGWVDMENVTVVPPNQTLQEAVAETQGV